MVIACIAIYDVQILDFIEVMLGGIGRIYTAHARVEAATENGGQAGFLEALLVGPLPAVFEVGHVLGLVVGRVQIVDTRFQTGFHDSQVLIGQGNVDDDFGLEAIEERNQFVHIVCIYLSGFDIGITDGFHDGVAFRLRAAGNHDFGEHVRILSYFVCNDGSYTACTDN